MEDSKQVISPQQAEERVAARHRVFLMLWIAILTSMSILFALAVFLPSSGTANETFSFALLGTAFVTVVMSLIIKQQMVKKAIDQQQTLTSSVSRSANRPPSSAYSIIS
jgi:uncharacterized membrane protein